MTEKLDPDDQGFTAVYSEKPIEYARRMAQESEYGDELAIEFYCMAFRRNVAVWTPGQDLPVVVTHLHQKPTVDTGLDHIVLAGRTTNGESIYHAMVTNRVHQMQVRSILRREGSPARRSPSPVRFSEQPDVRTVDYRPEEKAEKKRAFAQIRVCKARSLLQACGAKDETESGLVCRSRSVKTITNETGRWARSCGNAMMSRAESVEIPVTMINELNRLGDCGKQ